MNNPHTIYRDAVAAANLAAKTTTAAAATVQAATTLTAANVALAASAIQVAQTQVQADTESVKSIAAKAVADAAWSNVEQGMVSGMQRTNLGAAGAVSVTVLGTNMGSEGYTGGARGGHTGCEATEWMSGTALRCRIGESVKGSKRAVGTIDGRQVGTITQAWSVDLSEMSGMMNMNLGIKVPFAMTMYSASMAMAGYTEKAREGSTGCEGTEWESETSMKCLILPRNRAGSRRIVMTAGERGGTGSIGVSMDAVGISMTRRSNSAGSGSASVTVHGAGLGFAAFAAMIRGHQVGVRDVEW